MRTIKPGDILIRFLMPFSVWHYGIVIKVNAQNANDILLLEFADGDKITRVSLLDFMYGRTYFWIDDFTYERITYGDAVFYSVKERIKRALDFSAINGLEYTINKYNCEYFVRKCCFRDKKLWLSKQTQDIGQSKFSVFSKLFFLFAYGIASNHVDLSLCEVSMAPTKYKYIVCKYCGNIEQLNNDCDYQYYKCCCKHVLRMK